MLRIATALTLAGLVMFSTAAAYAQAMPSSLAREIMIKTTLTTFNDANLTNNYTVFNALASRPFSEQLPPEKLSEVFKTFRDQDIDISAITAFKPVEEPAPFIDSKGLLQMTGYFETSPSYVAYDMSFIGTNDGGWRMIAINVRLAPPAELEIDTGAAQTSKE